MARTLLIGLDGATFTVLDQLMSTSVMPVLADVFKRGARGELGSTANPLTAPAWTSLLTGVSPGHHGIFDFVRVEQTGSHPTFRLCTSSDIRSEMIWSIANRHGLRVISLNFAVMFPPRPLDGFMIPGFVPGRHLRRAVFPPELHTRLAKLPDFRLQDLSVDFEDERRSVQVLDATRYEEWIEYHIRREIAWFRTLKHLMETDPWDLAAVVFDGVDKLQHICWRFIDAELFPAHPTLWEQRVRDLCLKYFATVDGFIGELLGIAGPESRVFFASDHGFGPSDEIFYVNTWLEREGHLAWAKDVVAGEEGMLNTEGARTPAFLFDWPGTQAYCLTPGSNGVYFRVAREPGQAGMSEREYFDTRARVIDALDAVRSPVNGERVVRAAMPREIAFPGAYSALAPDLTLTLRDYGFVSVLKSDDVVKPRKEIAGVHRPMGIFGAVGPGIRAGVRIDPLSILDMTPALLYSLGLPIPAQFEGRNPEEIFDPALLASRPLQMEGEQAPRIDAELEGMDAEGEEQVIARLRSLGYVE